MPAIIYLVYSVTRLFSKLVSCKSRFEGPWGIVLKLYFGNGVVAVLRMSSFLWWITCFQSHDITFLNATQSLRWAQRDPVEFKCFYNSMASGTTVRSRECHGVSNHWNPDHLFNSLIGISTVKHQSILSLSFCKRNPTLNCAFSSYVTKSEWRVKHFHEVMSPWPWWRHQMEIFSALLAICAGNSPVSGEFPAQRPVTRSFDVFFDLCPNKRLSKQLEAGDLRRRRAHYDVTVMHHWTVHSPHMSQRASDARSISTKWCLHDLVSQPLEDWQSWNRKLPMGYIKLYNLIT